MTIAHMFPVGCTFFGWLIAGIAGGFFSFPCTAATECGCPVAILVILFYPIVAVIGIFAVMYETRSSFLILVGNYFEQMGGIVADLWVDCSPYMCLL